MEASFSLLVAVVIIALVFDFTNGFHDTANSIATVVGTRALSPRLAVLMAAALNFVGAFLSHEVAATVGSGIVDPSQATLTVVLAGLCGAILWNVATWAIGMPSNSSHALIGGLVGAGLAYGSTSAVLWNGVVQKVVLPAFIAPTLGFLAAMLMMAVAMRLMRRLNPAPTNRALRRAQIASGAWLSLTHGMNDAQKTMGIITLALATYAGTPDNAGDPPFWVIVAAASAMGLGTYAGGWKIIKTLGGKITKMNPLQGFSASVSGASVLTLAAQFGIPVSTTHCISGCVLGAGASRRFSSVRWTIAGDMVTAWVFTLPAAAVVGAISFAIASIHPWILIAAVAACVYMIRNWAQAQGTVGAH